jgi:hypothetical protein
MAPNPIWIPFFAIAAVMLTGVAITWIRVKHGYPMVDAPWGKGKAIDADGERKFHLLASENERLTGQISRLEERIAVLERIVTDPAQRVANQIDALR